MSLLTDEEIKLLGEGTSGTWQDDLQFARAVEAAVIKNLSEQSEPIEIEYPDYIYQGMGCGLEDRGITDRYEAMRYGWDCAIDAMAERIPDILYIHPEPQSEWISDVAQYLYQLLDDIDTASDIAKSNDVAYRSIVEKVQAKKSNVVETCDGYTVVFKPLPKPPEAK